MRYPFDRMPLPRLGCPNGTACCHGRNVVNHQLAVEFSDALVQERVRFSFGICWSGERRMRLHSVWSSKSGDRLCELRFCNSEGLAFRICDSPEQKPRFVFPHTHVPVFTQ